MDDSGVTPPSSVERLEPTEGVVNTDNASGTEPTAPQGEKVYSKANIAGLTDDELRAVVQSRANKFTREEFNLDQLYTRFMAQTAQTCSMSLLLIEKGIFTQQEADRAFFELLDKWLWENEQEFLPKIRAQRIKDALAGQPNGNVLGPDGRPIS